MGWQTKKLMLLLPVLLVTMGPMTLVPGALPGPPPRLKPSIVLGCLTAQTNGLKPKRWLASVGPETVFHCQYVP